MLTVPSAPAQTNLDPRAVPAPVLVAVPSRTAPLDELVDSSRSVRRGDPPPRPDLILANSALLI